jgi:hypothetical protein
LSRPEHAPRDRKVVMLMAALVILVLAINVISALVPGMDGALASMPIIVLLLVVGTLFVLGRSIRR